jgi:hypothetical protein
VSLHPSLPRLVETHKIDPELISQLADAWPRPHALALAVMFYAVGYAMCAGAENVSTVVAGQVIYTLGNTGITFCEFAQP